MKSLVRRTCGAALTAALVLGVAPAHAADDAAAARLADFDRFCRFVADDYASSI